MIERRNTFATLQGRWETDGSFFRVLTGLQPVSDGSLTPKKHRDYMWLSLWQSYLALVCCRPRCSPTLPAHCPFWGHINGNILGRRLGASWIRGFPRSDLGTLDDVTLQPMVFRLLMFAPWQLPGWCCRGPCSRIQSAAAADVE